MNAYAMMPETRSSPPATGRGELALHWWMQLTHPEDGDDASIAQLRRAHGTREALGIPAARDLVRTLGAFHCGQMDATTRDILDLARVLSHVKQHDAAQRPMQAAGWKRFAGMRREFELGDDRPTLSEARFRRLYEARDGEEKVAAFIRLVTLLDGIVQVTALANDFLLWNHPTLGDRVREQWAFDYYNASAAAPALRTYKSAGRMVNDNGNRE